ncbi:polyhydroxyalkanoic acid system family protein [Caenimonas koreensis]|uniref:Polyhydroxyalkanoic acid synthase n=1 Tax=Caenimonas koreensis DSM 17982 TaxID=1121255 RepID=A0A844B6C8_9BURK|nr:polyhydroxyalkanoic acid system family protein [Caenimonas koreensis]MRD47209.1 polyhydroxyalkanoic acid synthase [Caenimonas koreensis DSM 17982]
MAHIHISREHTLGLPQARKLAFKWAETAEDKLGMECTYEEGKTEDVVSFTRSGANGELKVTKDKFVLDAKLGLLLGAFRERIESEIVKNLDLLLQQKDPHKAFSEEIERRTSPKKEAAKPVKAAPAKAAPARKPAAKKKA